MNTIFEALQKENKKIIKEPSLVKEFNSMLIKLRDKYSVQFDFVPAVSDHGTMAVFDIYNKGTIDCLLSVFFDIASYEGLTGDELEAAMMKTAEDKIKQTLKNNFGSNVAIENDKQLESVGSAQLNDSDLNWLVVATSIDPTPDAGKEAEFKRVVGAFSMIIHAEDFINKCLPKDRKDSFQIVARSGKAVQENKNKKRIESVEMRKFNFRCRKCGNEFVAEYDYPLPTDCNACVTCPKCGGTACIKDSEPLEESKLKSKKGIGTEALKEGFGNFNVSEPSNFAPNGRSYFDTPKDWKEKHEWVKQQLEPKGYTCVGSSSWNSTWSNGNAIDEIFVDYWEDFDCIKEIVEMTLRSI